MLVRNVGLLDALLHGMREEIEAMVVAEAPVEQHSTSTGGFDLWSDDEAVMVRVDLPGIDIRTLDIALEGQRLTIRANRRALDVDLGETLIHAERAMGEIERIVELPCAVDASQSEAAYERGVLQITLPRAPHSRPKRIKVDVG